MWYENDVPALPVIDYSKPVVAVTEFGDKYLLIGHADGKGYDWFSLTEGHWNSSICWADPRDAVASYVERDYDVHNEVFGESYHD